jgi:hypothetical protein
VFNLRIVFKELNFNGFEDEAQLGKSSDEIAMKLFLNIVNVDVFTRI